MRPEPSQSLDAIVARISVLTNLLAERADDPHSWRCSCGQSGEDATLREAAIELGRHAGTHPVEILDGLQLTLALIR